MKNGLVHKHVSIDMLIKNTLNLKVRSPKCVSMEVPICDRVTGNGKEYVPGVVGETRLEYY